MQLQHINSEVPQLYFSQEAFSSKGLAQMSRRSLPGLTALTSAAIPLPHLQSQSDANGKMSTWMTPAHSTQPFLSAPAPLTAFAVQQDPTASLHHLNPLGSCWSQTMVNYV